MKKGSKEMSAEPVNEEYTYPFNMGMQIEGEARLIIEGNRVRVRLHLRNPLRTPFSQEFSTEGELDRSLFADDQQINDWFVSSSSRFVSRLWDFLAREAARFHTDIGDQMLDDLKIEEINMRDIVKKHARETEKGLHDALKLQGLGKFSAWTRLDLIRVIRAAFSKLPKKEHNYEAVAAWMKTSYPTTAPASGEALRQLVRRHTIDWKDLKTEVPNPLREEM